MALTFVASAGATGSGASVTCSTSLNVSAGDTLVCAVSWEGGDTTVSVAKDSGSPANSFTLDVADHTGQAGGSALFTAVGYLNSAAADGTATFKATLGASRTVPSIVVMQFRGGMTKGNRNIATSASGGVPSSGTIATTTTNSVVVGFISNDNGGATSSETINAVAADANPQDLNKLSGFYRILSATFATGAASASSLGGGVEWVASIMAFDEGTSNITGDAAITLGAVTLAATGTGGDISASASITLGTLTLTATGGLGTTADANITLGALTLAGTASASGSPAVAVGRPVFRFEPGRGPFDLMKFVRRPGATTNLAATPASASAAITLGALTVVATGSTGISGDAAITLGALTVAGTVAVAVAGTAAITLGVLVVAGQATNNVASGAGVDKTVGPNEGYGTRKHGGGSQYGG